MDELKSSFGRYGFGGHYKQALSCCADPACGK